MTYRQKTIIGVAVLFLTAWLVAWTSADRTQETPLILEYDIEEPAIAAPAAPAAPIPELPPAPNGTTAQATSDSAPGPDAAGGDDCEKGNCGGTSRGLFRRRR